MTRSGGMRMPEAGRRGNYLYSTRLVGGRPAAAQLPGPGTPPTGGKSLHNHRGG